MIKYRATKLPKQEVLASLHIAISKFLADKDTVIKYFCGVCWNKIRENKPQHKIIEAWVAISKKYLGKIAKYNETDVELLEKYTLNEIKSAMRRTFKYERTHGYWSFLLWSFDAVG